jgi:trehalose 6-phosphate phosphatase
VSSLAGKAGNIPTLLAPLTDEPRSSAIFCDIDGTLAPIVDRAADARVAAETIELLAQHADKTGLGRAGLRVEDKGPIRALHWRGADDEETAEAHARELATEAFGFGLLPHWGRKVLEIRPAVELNKGTALAELLEARGIAHGLYGGDDRTDVDAFRKLRAMTRTGDLKTAVCVGIASAEGPPEVSEEADVVVDGPPGFVAVLRLLE